MAGNVKEVKEFFDKNKDALADEIVHNWTDWSYQRDKKIEQWKEIRDYIFATDTRTTSNQHLPWKNSTTVPKLCQIRDNLHSNYYSALFPNDNWLEWEGYTQDAELKTKRTAIQAYMDNKTRMSDFRTVVSRLLYDYIDYGNAFCDVEFVAQFKEDENGERIPGYVGPKLRRISPYDIVFNPLATSFEESPKITRYIKTIGELKEEVQTQPDKERYMEAIAKAEQTRSFVSGHGSVEDINKGVGFQIDGFGDIYSYYQSNYVEILEFEGDIHNAATGVLLKDKIITVIDRQFVLSVVDHPSWSGQGYKHHVGWRLRPDNLYAMGPLDNLVGMQYRIDHLENLKADAMDLAVLPPLVIVGDVDEFDYGPNAEIHIDGEGTVTELGKNLNPVIAADNQISILENKMEQFAGAPREAMGIRTPGEKTAFEVQQLQNAAGRIFQEKITNFEVELLEKALNDMLEISRRNLDTSDVVRVMDDDLGVATFLTVKKEDITASGKLRPIGARHFGYQAQLLQSLSQTMSSPIGSVIAPHLSGKALARLVEDVLQIERHGVVQPNVAVMEKAETQQLVNSAQEIVELDNITDTEEL
jgi:hypothetical protein